MLSEERRREAAELCAALVRQQSYSGEEQGAAAELEDFFRGKGFVEITRDSYGCVICAIHGGRPGPRILFDGHIDTVPVNDAESWGYPPFAAEIHGEKMYGRGTSDMKGAVAAMACAIANFAKDTGGDFPGSLYLAGVVHEECFEGVAARSVSKLVKPDYVIIGEASELNLKIGQRGRGEIRLETYGKAAHSANPEKGVNAVYNMLRAVEAIRALSPTEHPVLGRGILELTDIKSEPYPGASVVPSYCAATYDRRLLVGETEQSVLAPIRSALESLAASDPDFTARVCLAQGRERCYTGAVIEGERFFPGWLFDREAPFVQAAYRGLRGAGFDPVITQYNFCTNGSHYAGEAGIPTLGLGPSREDLAHTRDEYIELSQLYGAVSCYEAVIRALQGM